MVNAGVPRFKLDPEAYPGLPQTCKVDRFGKIVNNCFKSFHLRCLQGSWLGFLDLCGSIKLFSRKRGYTSLSKGFSRVFQEL